MMQCQPLFAAVLRPCLPIILETATESFENRHVVKLGTMLIVVGVTTLLSWILMLFQPLNNAQLKKVSKGKGNDWAEFWDSISFLIPNKAYFATPLLTVVVVLVYVAMVFTGAGIVSFYADDLIAWGGNKPSLVLEENQWWRLFTCIFLHGGIFHVFGNIFSLILIGAVIEESVGSWKYLLVFLFTGLASSAVSLYFSDGAVSVGASGAIFGLYGWAIGLTLTRKLDIEIRGAIFYLAILVVGVNLLLGFMQPGIDNAGHIGGLVAGLILGFILPRSMIN